MSKSAILLVEDNPDEQELILLELRKNALANEIVVASDGQEALDYLFGKAGKDGRASLPAVVLLDLKLPKVDGKEVLQRIRADDRTRNLPVVMLTSSNEDADRRECYGLGANSYVRKPVNFSEFEEAVRQLKLYWLLLNEAS